MQALAGDDWRENVGPHRSANLSIELGFAPAVVKRLYAASNRQINDTRLLKQQIMEELSTRITAHQREQTE